MYLHIGQDTVIRKKEIIGIFDLDTSTVSKNTRDFLKKCEDEKKVLTVSSELPRSFVVTADKNGGNDRIYISQLSPITLEKRAY